MISYMLCAITNISIYYYDYYYYYDDDYYYYYSRICYKDDVG